MRVHHGKEAQQEAAGMVARIGSWEPTSSKASSEQKEKWR